MVTWQRCGFRVRSAAAVASTSLPSLYDRRVGVKRGQLSNIGVEAAVSKLWGEKRTNPKHWGFLDYYPIYLAISVFPLWSLSLSVVLSLPPFLPRFLCVFIYLPFAFFSFSLTFSLPLSLCLSVRACVSLCFNLSIYCCVCLCESVSCCLSVHLSVCLRIKASLHFCHLFTSKLASFRLAHQKLRLFAPSFSCYRELLFS